MISRTRLLISIASLWATQGAFAAVYDVRTYGATTASTDNSPAIQAAINAAQLAGGGEVYIPDFYRCAAGVTISGTNVRISGDGDRSGLFFESASLIINGVLFNGATRGEISGLRLVGSTATPTVGRLVVIAGGSDISVHDNALSGANRDPLGGPISGIAIVGAGSQNVRIERNQLSGNGPTTGEPSGYDIVNWTGAVSSQVFIRGNRVTNSNTQGSIIIFDTSFVDIQGNYVDQNNKIAAPGTQNGYGILLYNASSPIGPADISGNTIRNTAGSAIYLAGGHAEDREFAIHDNLMWDVAKQQSDVSLPVAGIALNGVNQVLVRGNRIDQSGKNGIELSTVNIATVDDNLATSAARYGIRVRFAVTATNLTNNKLAGNTTAPYTLAGGTAMSVSGNRFTGGAQQGVVNLVNGFANVSTTEVAAGDQILLSRQSFSGGAGALGVGSITPGTSFSIGSSDSGDQGAVFWQIVH